MEIAFLRFAMPSQAIESDRLPANRIIDFALRQQGPKIDREIEETFPVLLIVEDLCQASHRVNVMLVRPVQTVAIQFSGTIQPTVTHTGIGESKSVPRRGCILQIIFEAIEFPSSKPGDAFQPEQELPCSSDGRQDFDEKVGSTAHQGKYEDDPQPPALLAALVSMNRAGHLDQRDQDSEG